MRELKAVPYVVTSEPTANVNISAREKSQLFSPPSILVLDFCWKSMWQTKGQNLGHDQGRRHSQTEVCRLSQLPFPTRKDRIRPPYSTFVKVFNTIRLCLIPVNLLGFITCEATAGNGGKWELIDNKRIKALHTFSLSEVNS